MKTMFVAAAMASALSLSTPATAGFFDLTLAPYLGGSLGQATSDITCTAGTSCDDTGNAWKIFGGLEVNEYISMEVGYADMGEVKYTGTKTGTRDVNGMTMQLVGTMALNEQFTLIGKGGFGILHSDVKGNAALAGATLSKEDTDLEWMLGLGAQYNFTPSVGLRLEWERYFEVGGKDASSTGEADIDLITAGLVFKL
jgi:OOP family OmpA-OmpF porin